MSVTTARVSEKNSVCSSFCSGVKVPWRQTQKPTCGLNFRGHAAWVCRCVCVWSSPWQQEVSHRLLKGHQPISGNTQTLEEMVATLGSGLNPHFVRYCPGEGAVDILKKQGVEWVIRMTSEVAALSLTQPPMQKTN